MIYSVSPMERAFFVIKDGLFPANKLLFPEDEEDGAAEAERGPDEVQAEFLAHVDQGERHEDGQRDDLLHDLQLCERERVRPGVADAVRGHLEQIFEQRYAPADDGGQPPRLARHVFEVPVPGERHEAVRADEKEDRAVDGGDGDDGFDDFLHGDAVLGGLLLKSE